MFLPRKYILIGTNPLQDSYIFEMKLIPIADDLQFSFIGYKLQTKLTEALIQSFNANDSNVEYFNKLPKEQMYCSIFSEKIAQYVLFVFHQTINDPNNRNKQIVNINLPQLSPPLTLPFNFEQTFNTYLFLNQVITNFIYLKTEFFKENKVENNSSTLPIINNNIPVTSIIKTETTENINETNIVVNNNLEINPETLINYALSLCSKNNLLLYFFKKYINIYLAKNKIENEYTLNIDNNVLYISFEQLIPNNILTFSTNHLKDLILINYSIKDNQQDLQNKINLIFYQIMYICNNILSDPDKYKNMLHLPLKIYEMLFFIFIIKIRPDLFSAYIVSPSVYDDINIFGFKNSIHIVVTNYLNLLLKQSEHFKSLNFNNIIINHPWILTYQDLDLSRLREIIKNNSYLLNIHDDDNFIKVVKDEYETSPIKEKKKLDIVLSDPKLLTISNYIFSNNYDSTKHSYIYYNEKEITLNNKQDKILYTDEYYQILKLQINHLDLTSNELSPIIKKYSDILVKILQQITQDYNSFQHPVSTYYLLDKYIEPNVDELTSIQTEFIILYRIIIPYLYNYFKVTEFIDYFH